MAWKFIDEAEPPKNTDILVWNGEHEVTVRYDARGRFIAHSEGFPVLDPWERPRSIKGVTHWSPPLRPPA